MAALTIALAGNPNAGKTTVFNNLTGARQHVGNWAGVTVEKKEGRCRYQNTDILVVDLPGTYSLTAHTIEERVARDFILSGHADVVVDIVDASNLERNLYLTTQLLEMGVNLIIALNMVDVAKSRGILIDVQRLSELLGVPVVAMVAVKNRGTDQLLSQMLRSAEHPHPGEGQTKVRYPKEIEQAVHAVSQSLDQLEDGPRYPKDWAALKLLEGDDAIEESIPTEDTHSISQVIEGQQKRVADIFGTDAESVIVDARYGLVSGVGTEVLQRTIELRHTRSDQVDKVVTHQILGLPIFLAAIWFVFQMTANVSSAYLGWIDAVITGPITHWLVAATHALSLGGTWVESLIADGIIAGVGGVLVFVPVLVFLYFFIAILEDSGYMARAAFVTDRVMHLLGLHGKSFIPLLIGFGCNVPGIYATRTIEDRQDRIMTALLVPMMSCAARLPVYVIFATAFFPQHAGRVIFAMYFLGILAAIGSGLLFKNTLFRSKEQTPLVMELPPYRIPHLKGILIHMWERTYSFIRKAWTVILAASVIIWFLMHVPWGIQEHNRSLLGRMSRVVAPVFAPAGFGEWRPAGALVMGMVAKEVVVSSLSEMYAIGSIASEEETPSLADDLRVIVVGFGEATLNTVRMTLTLLPGIDIMPEEETEVNAGLVHALQAAFKPLSALSFMVFVLLYTPCVVTLAALRQELGTKWALFSVLHTVLLAWLGAVLVYQGGTLLGLS